MKKLLTTIALFLGFLASSQGEHVIDLNNLTGSFQKICNPIAPVQWVLPGERSYDPVNGIYYFLAQDANLFIIGVDVSTGSIVSQAPANGFMNFEYDYLSGKAYGFSYQNAGTSKKFGEFDLQTGSFTQIGPNITISGSMSQGMSAYNPFDKKFLYFEPGSLSYNSIDVINGITVASFPTTSLSAQNRFLSAPAFCDADSLTYFLVRDLNLQKAFLAKLKPSSGSLTIIGNGNSLYPLNLGYGAIDPVNKRYFHLVSDGTNFLISTFDLVTGTLLLTQVVSPLVGVENVFNVEYDKVRDQLFAIHWSESLEFLGVNSLNNSSEFGFGRTEDGQQYILTNMDENTVDKIYVTDMLGRMHNCDIHNVTNSRIIIKRSDLKSGMYCLHIKTTNGALYTEKMVFD